MLRKKIETFFYKNQNKGIPNLMLFLVIGSAVVYLLTVLFQNYALYEMLCFDRTAILQGQVWRLVTYVITLENGVGGFGLLFTVLLLYCFYSLGRAIEMRWGTCRFDCFLLVGVVMMDIYGMIFGCVATPFYLYTSLFLAYATLYPEARFLFLFVIPVRAWIFALVDLGLTVLNMFSMLAQGAYASAFFPLVAIANYFLFFGPDVANILPPAWQVKRQRKAPKIHVVERKPAAVEYKESYQSKPTYNHKCAVCGRTDVSNPELEFRYCSRCNGYYCYCQDHINNHEHIQ